MRVSRTATAAASLFLTGLACAASDRSPQGRTPAANMDPYAPIRNSALHFELGADWRSQGNFFAPKNDSIRSDGAKSASDRIKFANAASLTTTRLRIRHGFVAGTEAILDVPYILASGDARRFEPLNNIKGDAQSPVSAGFGDWTLAIKSSWEEVGLGGYFGLVLPIGNIFGTAAYTNGDGEIDAGIFFDREFADQFQILSNFVYGYDLPATNQDIRRQDSYTAYLRLGGLLADRKYRPYVAMTYEGYGNLYLDKEKTYSGGFRAIVTPGIDLNVSGDFGAELSVPYTVAGKGNGTVATPADFGVNFAIKYFWFRF